MVAPSEIPELLQVLCIRDVIRNTLIEIKAAWILTSIWILGRKSIPEFAIE